MKPLRRFFRVAISFAVLPLLSCATLDAPDQNATALTDLTVNPTPSAVTTATQGLIRGIRGDAGTIAQSFGILGREGYNLDPGNPQNVANYFVVLGVGPLWGGPYSTIKLAEVVLAAVDAVTAFPDSTKQGIRGFAKTIEALELLNVIRSTDQGGAALNVAAGATAELPPIVNKSEVYARIFQLLDEARMHLLAAGSTFAFNLGSGFAGFNTPAAFLAFNRALRARADTDLSNWNAALTDLSTSFLDPTKPLTLGVYHTFSTVSGDVTNPVFEAAPRNFWAHPSLATQAQLKANSTRDNRFLAKVRAVPPFVRTGFPIEWTFQVYASPSSSIAIIRNEELILLRAEANIGLGNTAAAVQDINTIRVNAGGLPPISEPYVPGPGQPATLLDELLYEKRYSLLWEVGTTWLDARHYGKLAQLPHDLPGQLVFPYLPIPAAECTQRTPPPAGCASPAGL